MEKFSVYFLLNNGKWDSAERGERERDAPRPDADSSLSLCRLCMQHISVPLYGNDCSERFTIDLIKQCGVSVIWETHTPGKYHRGQTVKENLLSWF